MDLELLGMLFGGTVLGWVLRESRTHTSGDTARSVASAGTDFSQRVASGVVGGGQRVLLASGVAITKGGAAASRAVGAVADVTVSGVREAGQFLRDRVPADGKSGNGTATEALEEAEGKPAARRRAPSANPAAQG